MANETKCLTPGTHFTTIISGNKVSIEARLPFELDITANEAEILETLLHNQMEITLRPYFTHSMTLVEKIEAAGFELELHEAAQSASSPCLHRDGLPKGNVCQVKPAYCPMYRTSTIVVDDESVRYFVCSNPFFQRIWYSKKIINYKTVEELKQAIESMVNPSLDDRLYFSN